MIELAPAAGRFPAAAARIIRLKENIMRFTALPVLALLALGTVACGAATTTAVATVRPADTIAAPATATPEVVAATATPSGPLGSISGAIKPPPVQQPGTAMRILARDVNQSLVYFVDLPIDSATYTIGNLPMGTYYVFGWYSPNGLPGAHTSSSILVAETSSDQLTCSNALAKIKLTVGRPDFQGADIACWGGDYFTLMTPMP
jgi:hypothetical protein